MKSFYKMLLVGFAASCVSCSSFIKNKAVEPFPVNRIFIETPVAPSVIEPFAFLKHRASFVKAYVAENRFSDQYCFLVDMNIPSGQNRFFVYDLTRNTVIITGLVAHGSCNQGALATPKFSNNPSCGCSSIGKYKIGAVYKGQYGKSYRLHGLENTNSNAYKRAIVLHGWRGVPDAEIYPKPLCNSLGCTMVSNNFFLKISKLIDQSKKPILLWVYR